MVYHQPEQLAEALHLLGQVPGIQVAAGCTDLFPATAGPALGGPVLDITRVQGLRGISQRPFG